MRLLNILRRKSSAFFIAVLGLGLLVAVLAVSSSRASIDVQENQATIHFAAEYGYVWLPGDCLTVRWKTDRIREIYLNGTGQIGEGQQQFCVDSQTLPTLTVKFLDGSQQDYVLPVTILLINPLFILSIVLLGWAVIVLWGTIIRPISAASQKLRVSGFVRKLPKRLALTALVIGITCLMLEAVLHFYFSHYGSQTDRIKYVMTREEIRNLNNILVPLPYVNYVPSPDYPDHNSLGYRGPDIAIPKPKGVYRIVALGGSTTYSSATSYADSYPAQLQNVLRDEYGYTNVEVINGGFIGYTTWETLVNFEFRVLELEPDMIILYEGVNDITPREQISVDCYRGHNILRGLNPDRGFWIEQDTPLSSSTLYRFIAINLGWMPDPSAINSAFELPQANCQLDNLPVDQRVAENPPDYFERNMRNILLIAQGNHVQPVLSTWAYYVKQDRPEYWRIAVNENNAIIKNLATEMQVPLYDLAANLPVNAQYWGNDGIHMFLPGNHELAEEYAAFLDEQNLLPKPQ
jgi:lysophospholipase L1-like esterase/multisubunit Na+/H+ antiporter MnhC subunit